MIKIKGLLVVISITMIGITFFVGNALAERVAKINKEKGHVFINGKAADGLEMEIEKRLFFPSGEPIIDSTVQEISTSESVVENNRKLMVRRKKRKSTEQIYREDAARQKIIQEDYIRRMQERERIENEEDQERNKEQEKKEEQERKEEEKRIKEEDWFR